jgi:two-component system, chemotaxis family, protein-glutamate methylesterase/glutaminase
VTVRNATIRALLVQDGSPQRTQLIRVLQRDGDISVVGQATTAAEAIQHVHRDRPDVIILDLQLGDGGSQHAIEQIMARNPTPILVLSARIDDRHSPSAVEALIAGALDAQPTPAQWTPERGAELRHNVRQLRKVVVIRHPRGGLVKTVHRARSPGNSRPVVAVAASTGGPTALASLLSGLGGLPAPVLVVQHLRPEFTSGLWTWMSRVSALPFEMAQQGLVPEPGHVYLAPGDLHLRLRAGFRLDLNPVPASIHRPSADQLFRSVAEQAGASGVGVLLTGMGEDGAQGLLEIHRKGGRTLAQDEASCAVFGMPRAAQLLGAVEDLLPLEQLAAAVRWAVSDIRA